MSEVAMWLFPVAFAAIAGIFFCFRMSPRWTWGICAQQSIVLACAMAGFFYLFPPHINGMPPASESKAALCAWFTWFLFGLFNIGQRLVLNQISTNLSLLK